MVMPSGTIIQRKSAITEGATAILPNARVCCVAMARAPTGEVAKTLGRMAARFRGRAAKLPLGGAVT